MRVRGGSTEEAHPRRALRVLECTEVPDASRDFPGFPGYLGHGLATGIRVRSVPRTDGQTSNGSLGCTANQWPVSQQRAFSALVREKKAAYCLGALSGGVGCATGAAAGAGAGAAAGALCVDGGWFV